MVVINLKGGNYSYRTYHPTFTTGENAVLFDVTINHDETFDLVIDPTSLPRSIIAGSLPRARVEMKYYGRCDNIHTYSW